MIAISGIIKGGWGQIRFVTESIFGPAATTVLGGFFIFWGMLSVFAIKKFGAGTVVMTLGAPFELAAGNPFGMMVYAYDFFEGLGADIAFGLFRYRFSGSRYANLIITGAVGAINSLISYIVFGITLNLFNVPLWTNIVLMGTSCVVAVFWGIFAYTIYNALQRVRAVPPA